MSNREKTIILKLDQTAVWATYGVSIILGICFVFGCWYI